MKKIDFSKIEKALESLQLALTPPPRNDRELDGAIQRFEYTFELSWKVAQKCLSANGIDAPSPKAVIREMGRQGSVDSEKWLHYLVARNSTVHTYDTLTAEQVFAVTKDFATACRQLVEQLKSDSEQ